MPIIAVVSIVHDDCYYVNQVIKTVHLVTTKSDIQTHLPSFAFVSRTPLYGTAGNWQRAKETAKDAGFTVVEGEWNTEWGQRQAAVAHLLSLGYTHALIPDGDEIIEQPLLDALLKIAQNELADRVYVHWDTYWKSPEYVIRPRERFTPCYLIDLRAVEVVGIRDFAGGRPLLLGPEYGIVHHLSWVGPEERIRRKRATWAHAPEVVEGWEVGMSLDREVVRSGGSTALARGGAYDTATCQHGDRANADVLPPTSRPPDLTTSRPHAPPVPSP